MQLGGQLQNLQEDKINLSIKIVLVSAEVERLRELNEKIWEDNCVL